MFLWLLTFIVLPIVGGEDTLQMLNCSVVKSPPEHFFFSPFRRHISQLLGRGSKDAFVHLLFFDGAIPVNLFLSAHPVNDSFLGGFWFGESLIHHILIVVNETHLPSESLVPVVLRLCELIHFLLVRGNSALHSLGWVSQLRVISKVIVKGSFVSSGLIHYLKTSGAVRDIGVTASSIVCIIYWL